MSHPEDRSLARAAAASHVASLVGSGATMHPERVAIIDGERRVTYRDLHDRTRSLAAALAARGIGHGDRIALLADNDASFLQVVLAAAHLGAIVACQNWRLAEPELRHCLSLVEPKLAFASKERREQLEAALAAEVDVAELEEVEGMIASSDPIAPRAVDPEDPLLILYTSGTTGLPKGATISHRAEIARNLVVQSEFGLSPEDTYVAWSPMYHMGGIDFSLGTLMSGGTVRVVRGFDAEQLADIVAREKLGWLLLMPGMVGAFAEVLRDKKVTPAGVKVCGVMADLVPPAEIAAVTSLLDAPYANTFGATETGCPPCSSSLLPVGEAPTNLAKRQSPYCEVRLVDANDQDVADGEPGELCMRGPTLFSGYWRAPDVNAEDFRGGWFHMGDVFVRNPDGTLTFVDRVKYLIKSGGENIYPAEIERVLLADPRVAEAAVVRRPDEKWGEVPVAFVAKKDDTLDAEALVARCRAELAGYKQPKGIEFIDVDDFPRSASGKVKRHELEKRLAKGAA